MKHNRSNDQHLYNLLITALFLLLCLAQGAAAQSDPQFPAKYPDFPSETPTEFKPTNVGFDHERRTEMILMRDGVKLHTVILLPKGATSSPILLTRTPYSADELTRHVRSM